MIDMTHKEKIDRFLEEMVRENQFPGAVYAIVTERETLAENAIGFSHRVLNIPMSLNTIFDMASLTKVCVTTPAILLLIQEGKIDIDDPVKRYFSQCLNGELTIRHLLTHTSGLMWHMPFYQYGWNKEEIKDYILKSRVHPGIQVEYSDLNFILLGFLIEQVTGQTLDEFVRERIFSPLGMRDSGFNPNFEKEKMAPTEYIQDKKDYQWGTVHDENAAHLGGVSGHAGLFSSLQDMKIYCQMILRNGRKESGELFLSEAILKESRRNYTKALNLSRGLGWQLVDDTFSPLGHFLSKQSFGHTGFTGTSIWMDPERKIAAILLTNRVYFGREINSNRFRRVFHNLIAASL